MKKFREYREKDEYGAVLNEIELLENKFHSTMDEEDILDFLYESARAIEEEATSFLEKFFEHWLKWKYIPQLRTNSWLRTLKESMIRLCKLLRDNKSLKKKLIASNYDSLDGLTLYEDAYDSALELFLFDSKKALKKAPEMLYELEEATGEDFSYLLKPISEEVPFSLEDLVSGKVLNELGDVHENLRANFYYR